MKKWQKFIRSCNKKKNSVKVIKNGGNLSTLEYDGFIANYLKDLRANYIPVNNNDIIIKAKEII